MGHGWHAKAGGARRALWCAAVAAALFALAGPARAEVTADELQQRIDHLVAQIKGAQSRSGEIGAHAHDSWPVGRTSLAVLGLRAAGVPPQDRVLQKATEYLLANRADKQRGVYQTSLRIMALAALDPLFA